MWTRPRTPPRDLITPADIEILAKGGVTLLRISTTYAAWVKVPGSQLYSGNQASFLESIAGYAVAKYNMHVNLDIHPLPGGVNGMAFGEKVGNFGWFNKQTALQYSYKAVSAASDFIQTSGFPDHFTPELLSEPVGNPDITAFGSPFALSDAGADWVTQYIQGVLKLVQAIDPEIPVMLSDGFKGEAYFAPSFPVTSNLVLDIHNYYFAGRPISSANATTYICSDAKASAPGKFPTFVGEWSIDTAFNNTLAGREKLLNTGLYAFGEYTAGSS